MELDLTRAFPRIEKAILAEFAKVKPFPFIAGQTYIPASTKVFSTDEILAAIKVILSFDITDGKVAEEFERIVSRACDRSYGTLCNSGSSANLLALSALTSDKLQSRQLRKKQEVITSAVGFPTTVNAILQLGLVPVFVDVKIPTYNADPVYVEDAVTENTGAILLAHTLGNPNNVRFILDIAEEKDIWVVYDCCDGLGGEVMDRNGAKPLASYGDLSTLSFYPAHQITTGEGGMVLANSPMLDLLVRSFRDWGRSCYCKPGKDNTCGHRFDHKYLTLPDGYDHKYVYDEIGYNLKSTDIQAAIGIQQMKRLSDFTARRRKNWEAYHSMFEELEDYFILPEPEVRSDPAWFGFCLTLQDGVKFSRTELTRYLESKQIGTRNLFGGNLLRQPAYKHLPRCGNFRNADIVTERTFWIGVGPYLTEAMQNYVFDMFKEFVR